MYGAVGVFIIVVKQQIENCNTTELRMASLVRFFPAVQNLTHIALPSLLWGDNKCSRWKYNVPYFEYIVEYTA